MLLHNFHCSTTCFSAKMLFCSSQRQPCCSSALLNDNRMNNYLSCDPHYVILRWVQSWNIFEKLMKLWSPPEFIHKIVSHEQLLFNISTTFLCFNRPTPCFCFFFTFLNWRCQAKCLDFRNFSLHAMCKCSEYYSTYRRKIWWIGLRVWCLP